MKGSSPRRSHSVLSLKLKSHTLTHTTAHRGRRASHWLAISTGMCSHIGPSTFALDWRGPRLTFGLKDSGSLPRTSWRVTRVSSPVSMASGSCQPARTAIRLEHCGLSNTRGPRVYLFWEPAAYNQARIQKPMLCENCQKQIATVHLTVIVEGRQITRNYCPACYNAAKSDPVALAEMVRKAATGDSGSLSKTSSTSPSG